MWLVWTKRISKSACRIKILFFFPSVFGVQSFGLLKAQERVLSLSRVKHYCSGEMKRKAYLVQQKKLSVTQASDIIDWFASFAVSRMNKTSSKHCPSCDRILILKSGVWSDLIAWFSTRFGPDQFNRFKGGKYLRCSMPRLPKFDDFRTFWHFIHPTNDKFGSRLKCDDETSDRVPQLKV